MKLWCFLPPPPPPQLFLQRERAAVLAEAQTDDLIKEAPKPALDQSGEWQETGGEIQWVANDNQSDAERQEDGRKKEKDEEDEELDLNKGTELCRRRASQSDAFVSTGAVYPLTEAEDITCIHYVCVCFFFLLMFILCLCFLIFQLCITQGSTWRTASWRPTQHCCWAACVRGAR